MTNINIQITEINGLVYLAIRKEGSSTLQTIVDNKEDLMEMIKENIEGII